MKINDASPKRTDLPPAPEAKSEQSKPVAEAKPAPKVWAAPQADAKQVKAAVRGDGFGAPSAPTRGAAASLDGASSAPGSGILYVGMIHDHAPVEARLLQAGAPKEHLSGITSSAKNGAITDTTGKHDLTTANGIHAFVASLGCPADASAELEKLLGSVEDDGAKNEAAQVIQAYARADKTGTGMNRVVLSGHSDSETLGGDNGDIPFTFFQGLAKVFPKAAAQVQHLMVSSCYSGGQVVMDPAQPGGDAGVNYHEMFPNVKTILAYTGSSPSAATGSLAHIKRWEAATQGPQVRKLDQNLEKGMYKAENVATWSADGGYKANEKGQDEEVSEFLDRLHDPGALKVLDSYFSGDKECKDPGSGELHAYSDTLHRLLGNPLLKGADRTFVKDQTDLTVRLRYYPSVSAHFAAEYGPDLAAGYAAAHRPLPKFDQMSRKAAMGEIAAFLKSQQGSTDPAVRRCTDLLTGLQQLSPAVIPFKWV